MLSRVLLLAAATAVTASPPLAAQAAPLEWTPIAFTSGSGERTQAETAWITVPERHANPAGPKVRLPLLRFRSTNPNPGPPIVYLAGGPGNSGMAAAMRDLYFPIAMAMREVADVVFYDQRGTGTAEPNLNITGTFELPLELPVASPQARVHAAARARRAADEVRGRGVDLAAYNTVESADDLEDIRRALGAERISLWGHSYGSHLALAYVRRHGGHVNRMIVGGINGPGQRWRYPGDGQALLERVDSAVRAHPRLSPLVPDLVGTTRRVLARLDAEPARVRVDSQTVVIGGDEVRVLIALSGGELDFITRLPMLMAALDAGRYEAVAGPVVAGLKQRPLRTAMSYTMHLASGVSPERLRRIEAEAAGALLRDAINFPFSDPGFRAAWGVEDLGEEFRGPLRSPVPALFLSGRYDGRTSVSDAEEVRSGFPSGVHVVIDGVSHDFYGATPAIRDLMMRFLRGEPVRDTTISVPLEFHGPDEPVLVGELQRVAREQGGAAAAARLREMAAPGAPGYLSSYVVDGAAAGLLRADSASTAAIELLRAGVELFPRQPALHMRLGAALRAAGDRTGAADAYRRAVALNPMLRFAAVQLARLEGREP
jgi:pimeloyl-ACP methyl ester carboxylesterase